MWNLHLRWHWQQRDLSFWIAGSIQEVEHADLVVPEHFHQHRHTYCRKKSTADGQAVHNNIRDRIQKCADCVRSEQDSEECEQGI